MPFRGHRCGDPEQTGMPDRAEESEEHFLQVPWTQHRLICIITGTPCPGSPPAWLEPYLEAKLPLRSPIGSE